jgi:hypothetical protein
MCTIANIVQSSIRHYTRKGTPSSSRYRMMVLHQGRPDRGSRVSPSRAFTSINLVFSTELPMTFWSIIGVMSVRAVSTQNGGQTSP